ncbi:hypothetical protein F3Y22_tig00001340pilonHSYRG00033 [Hibiscus syriacus]|uniref:Uncharacterized protein n=1 Tax=Hibiscus syriacus TaxID=106335 RepID=A0A6A3CXW0_HIBSY|nr:hypothetical protein F3Y22_tig00001340pilonHSYRG00033 [Hibiscus syriacus]
MESKGFQVTASACDVLNQAQLERNICNKVGNNIGKMVMDYTAEDVSFLTSTNFESAYNINILAHPLLKASASGDS